MKKILFGLLTTMMMVVCGSIHAQQTPGIYYDGTKLEYSKIIGQSVKTSSITKNNSTKTKTTTKKIVQGKSAKTQIDKREGLEFVLVFGEEDKETGYIFTDKNNADKFMLVKLDKKKNERNLFVSKVKVKDGVTETDLGDAIPVVVDKSGDSVVKVKVDGKLKKGEYGFYYTGEVPDKATEFSGVFDFTIK